MLKTVWGEALCPEAILTEYPRPQMRRADYTILNGAWEYAVTDSDAAPKVWNGTILVPFSPETKLSGVKRDVRPDDRLWYRRRLDAAPQAGKRLILHFGAVDQMATVYLNGKELGSHIGGYTPFSFDITEHLCGENELLVRVRDLGETCELSRGKQKAHGGGIWYTRQSGIWQTVWCEWVPEQYIRSLKITPDCANSQIEITVNAAQSSLCYIDFGEKSYGCRTNQPMRITVADYEAWSPEHPKLYSFTVRCGADTVESYFAMRCIEMKPDARGIPRLHLNGKPYFHTGVLDQGYWPESLLTAPSDTALIYDIECMKQLGFNMLRKHIKVEPLRFYYHCDRLGMLVWQDMPSGGGHYKFSVTSIPLVTGVHRSDCGDSAYKVFARTDERARKHFELEMTEIVSHLYNCPSVVLWVPFNEGWGQFDAARLTEKLRALDPTRLIDHASGWHDQGVSDLKSLHVYFKPYRFRADKHGRAVALSEFGGYSLAVKDHTFADKTFGYRKIKSGADLTRALRALYEKQVIPAAAKGLCAAVYTQLSDVETESNGFVTYDRKVLKVDADTIRAINKTLTK